MRRLHQHTAGRCCNGVVLQRVFRNHGTFREPPNYISISEQSQLSPLSPLASKNLYMRAEYKTSPRNPVKKYFGRIKETEGVRKGLRGYPGPLMCVALALCA